MSKFTENQEFLARVISASPTGNLTSEQEERLFELIQLVDAEWHRMRLNTMRDNVVSHFPWRQLSQAPKYFVAILFDRLEEFDPNYDSYYRNKPIEEYLSIRFTQLYEEQTGVGQWVDTSIPLLRQLILTTVPANRQKDFLGLLTTYGGYGSLSKFEYTRRWLLRAGIQDILRTDLVRFIGSMIDYDINHDIIGFRNHESDPNYSEIERIIKRVTGYWENPRIIQRAYELSLARWNGQIELEEMVDGTLNVIYSVGQEAYQRARRLMSVYLGRRLYKPGERRAEQAIVEAKGLATRGI